MRVEVRVGHTLPARDEVLPRRAPVRQSAERQKGVGTAVEGVGAPPGARDRGGRRHRRLREGRSQQRCELEREIQLREALDASSLSLVGRLELISMQSGRLREALDASRLLADGCRAQHRLL